MLRYLRNLQKEVVFLIGSGLKKLAKEYGMTVSGVAYGSLGGFAATLSEGAGFKRIVFPRNSAIRRVAPALWMR